MANSGAASTNAPSSSSSKSVLVAVANGSEEVETVSVVDTLVRAGANVTLASVEDSLQVTASRGVKLVADAHINDCRENAYDVIVCPGGMPGAAHLRDNAVLTEMLKGQAAEGRIVAAICAAPAVVLASHGLTDEAATTCFPKPHFRDMLKQKSRENEDVVVDGKFITSQGPGTALRFAVALVDALFGPEKASEIATQLLVTM